MKFKKLICILLSVLLVFSVSGCKIIEVTEENKSSAVLDPNGTSNTPLFKTWKPLDFQGGESFCYHFLIEQGEFGVTGKFELSVRNAFLGLTRQFDWKFTINSDDITEGSFIGSSQKFLENFYESCRINAVHSMVYEALFTTYKDAYLYVSESTNFQLMPEQVWKTELNGVEYVSKVESISAAGNSKIDAYEISTSIGGVLSHVFALSPHMPLPPTVMLFIDSDGEDSAYIVCELQGAILK